MFFSPTRVCSRSQRHSVRSFLKTAEFHAHSWPNNCIDARVIQRVLAEDDSLGPVLTGIRKFRFGVRFQRPIQSRPAPIRVHTVHVPCFCRPCKHKASVRRVWRTSGARGRGLFTYVRVGARQRLRSVSQSQAPSTLPSPHTSFVSGLSLPACLSFSCPLGSFSPFCH